MKKDHKINIRKNKGKRKKIEDMMPEFIPSYEKICLQENADS